MPGEESGTHFDSNAAGVFINASDEVRRMPEVRQREHGETGKAEEKSLIRQSRAGAWTDLAHEKEKVGEAGTGIVLLVYRRRGSPQKLLAAVLQPS